MPDSPAATGVTPQQQDLPAQEGFAAAERHFSASKMNPELLLIETDRELRNSADFLVIDKIAKAVFKVPGVGSVQAITRPQGEPLEFSTIPSQMSMGGANQQMNQKHMEDMFANMLLQADDMQSTIDTMTRTVSLIGEMSATTHNLVGKTSEMVVDIRELRDNISNFDDFIRPLRNYLYWEQHYYNIPVCWSMRSVFDALDGTDQADDAVRGDPARHAATGHPDAADAGNHAGTDRVDGISARHDAADVSDSEGHPGPGHGDAGQPECHG